VSLSSQDVITGPTVMVPDRYSMYANPSLAFPKIWDLAPDRCSEYGSGSSNSHERDPYGFGSTTFLPVLGIRDILVRIRIVPLANESGSGSNSGSDSFLL
jgi:hypothetical protein